MNNPNMTPLEVEQELDRIYDLEDLIMDGRFETLDTILENVDAENIHSVFLLAYVLVSRLAEEHLKNYKPLVETLHRRFPQYKNIG